MGCKARPKVDNFLLIDRGGLFQNDEAFAIAVHVTESSGKIAAW